MNKSKYFLIIIIGLGFLLRFINIQSNPPSLYGDELTMVYDTYSLLKTGHDQTGAFLPLTFSMGAGRPAGYVYASIPFVALFGPTALGVRMLAIISGTVLIWLIYLLAKKLFNQPTALIAASLTAISPWGIDISRAGFEANFALVLAVGAVTALIYAKTKPWLLIISALAFSLAIHTYPTYKLVLPLVILLIIILGKVYSNIVTKKNMVYSVISCLLIVVAIWLSFQQTVTAGSEERFSTINVLSQLDLREKLIQKVNEDRNLSTLPSSFIPLFHNRSVEYFSVLAEAYLNNFSWQFLFVHGDGNPRHNMATMGGVWAVEIISLFFGLVYLWKEQRLFYLLVGWLLIAPLATTLLLEPHFLRNSFMIPPLLLISASGFYYLWTLHHQRSWQLGLSLVVGGLVGLQLAFYLNHLYFVSPNQFSRFWAYPAKLASETVLREQINYDYVILSDQIDNSEFAYPVYGQIDPNLVISQNKQRTTLLDRQFKKIDNVYIGALSVDQAKEFIDQLDGSVLYLGAYQTPTNLPNAQVLSGLDKMPALIKYTKP